MHGRLGVIERAGRTIAFSSITLRRTTDRGALLEVMRLILLRFSCPGVCAPECSARKFRVPLFGNRRRGRMPAPRERLDAPAGRRDDRMEGSMRICVVPTGLISAAPFVRARGAGYSIEPEALAAFQSKYVPVAALSREAGCSSRGMLRRFADEGIATHGVFVDGTARRGHLVRIADLAPPRRDTFSSGS